MIKIISVKTITKRLNESTNNIIPNTTVGGFPLSCNNFSSQMSLCVEKNVIKNDNVKFRRFFNLFRWTSNNLSKFCLLKEWSLYHTLKFSNSRIFAV